MEKQKKIQPHFKAVVGKKAFPGPGNSENEMDADELVHQSRHEAHDDAVFDEDEAIHTTKRNTNTEPGSKEDIDDLVHENEDDNDEAIY